ncbi:MAG: heparinase II/III domain-containing protein, partial [Verrucomicrobiota bacterium]
AVPVIAGKLQRAGSSARGVVLQSRFTPESDTLRLDIRSAYDVPALQRLEREFRFQRGAAPSLTVTDEIAFSKASTYETALITWGKWQRVSERELLISDGADAVQVQIDSGGLPFEIASETIDEDVHTPTKPVRLGLKLKSPVTKAQFKVTVTSAAAEASAALKK